MHRPANITHSKVRDNPHLIRCMKSKAILTTNQVELNKYKIGRAHV